MLFSGDFICKGSIPISEQLGSPKPPTFSKRNNASVKTAFTYSPHTGTLQSLITQKVTGGIPVSTYQNLSYQYDGKVNITVINNQGNGITHNYTYDSLDRLLTGNGAGNNPYSQSYGYDRMGNITSKSDVGSYSYNYSSKRMR